METQLTVTEIKMQSDCFLWFHNSFPAHRGRLRRIKNEFDNYPRKTDLDYKKQGNENKATGVVRGDSDFYFINNPLVFIELKLPGRTQSDPQKDFQKLVESYGYRYELIKSREAFKELILNLLNGKEKQRV